MAGVPWTADELRQAEFLAAEGKTIAEIAATLGRSESAVRNKFGAHLVRPSSVTTGPTLEDIQAFQQVAEVHAPTDTDRPPVTPALDDDFDPEVEWDRLARRNAQKINKANKRHDFRVSLGSDPVALAFVSDQHISEGNVDLVRMREDAQLIAQTRGMHALLVGDGVDNHVKIRAAMVNKHSAPADEYILYDYYLKILATKILCVISGNHDNWTTQAAGVDMVAWLCERNKINAYAPDEAFVKVDLAGQEYEIGIRHQFRMNSSFNLTHTVKQWLRMGERPDLDICAIGHHHEPALETCVLWHKERVLMRPGSYQIQSPYSRMLGFAKARPTAPTVVLYPGSRKMIGFYDVRDAATWMRY